MARQGKTTADEILAAEKAVDDRRQSRKLGFAKMHERDAGHADIRNFVGPTIKMLWPVDYSGELQEGVARTRIKEGFFVLEIGKEKAVIDAEEFRRHLRWV